MKFSDKTSQGRGMEGRGKSTVSAGSDTALSQSSIVARNGWLCTSRAYSRITSWNKTCKNVLLIFSAILNRVCVLYSYKARAAAIFCFFSKTKVIVFSCNFYLKRGGLIVCATILFILFSLFEIYCFFLVCGLCDLCLNLETRIKRWVTHFFKHRAFWNVSCIKSSLDNRGQKHLRTWNCDKRYHVISCVVRDHNCVQNINRLLFQYIFGMISQLKQYSYRKVLV